MSSKAGDSLPLTLPLVDHALQGWRKFTRKKKKDGQNLKLVSCFVTANFRAY
jgi:hypothetical protein